MIRIPLVAWDRVEWEEKTTGIRPTRRGGKILGMVQWVQSHVYYAELLPLIEC